MKDLEKKLNKIADYLRNGAKIALICHMNPDGDTVGAALALYGALRIMGKEADVFCVDQLSERLRYLPFSDKFNIGRERKYDVSVAVDCGDAGRMGLFFELFSSAAVRLCIDHHHSNNLECDCALIDPSIASTSELVFSIIKKFPEACMTKDVASLLYAGILTDSGCFTYPAVTKRTHEIVAELYAYGIDAADIAYNVFKKTTIGAFNLANRVLSRARFFADGRIGVAVFFLKDFEETGVGPDVTEGLVNCVQNIGVVKVALALSEIDPLRFRVSIRTKEPISASKIAGVFGGGGHKLAAGCRIVGSIEEVLEKIVKAASDTL